MIQVDKKDLKRNKIYMLYSQSVSGDIKELFFFTYRDMNGEDSIKAIVHGSICQKNFGKTVVDSFWKREHILYVNSLMFHTMIFEIEFSEFVQHVVSETI